MPERGLQDLLALHELLSTLDDAGVHVELGVSRGRVRSLLTTIGREVTTSVGCGKTLDEALDADDTSATRSYRQFVAAWRSGAELAPLLSSRCQTDRLETERQRLRVGLIYPITVTVFACLGIAAMVSWVLPHIESAYTDLGEPVGWGIATLRMVRNAIPIGAIAVPLALAAGVYAALKASPPSITSKSRALGAIARGRLAQASRAAGALIRGGIAPKEALQHTGITAKGEPARRLPALIDWLRASQREQSEAADDLQAVGDLYEGMATRGAQRVATLLPALTCVVVAGGATLAYALALFLPVIEMLWTIAH